MSRLTKEQQREVADRFVAGDTQKDLAEEFGVSKNTIVRACLRLHARREAPPPAKVKDMAEFTKRAKSILWRLDPGAEKDRKNFNEWNARVTELASPDGGGLKKYEAVVRASKEYPCLKALFREYDVRAYDPNPDSHAHVQHYGEPAKRDCESEGLDQTYRESLRWAIDAAGATSRTGQKPKTCPCDTAYYLYEQAVSDPKDFLARLGQQEAKGDAAAADKQGARAAGTRAIAEIDGMLAELNIEEGEEDAI